MEDDEFKLILMFKEEHDIRKVSPVTLSHWMKDKLGDLLMAKVLSNGSLVIKYKDEQQREKVNQSV